MAGTLPVVVSGLHKTEARRYPHTVRLIVERVCSASDLHRAKLGKWPNTECGAAAYGKLLS
jgi:hypothetical protein